MKTMTRRGRRHLLLLTLLAAGALPPAGCFRKAKKGAILLAADDTAAGPKAFRIDQPIVPIQAEPALLSWRPSSGATSYVAVVATTPDCSGAVYQQLGLLDHQMTAPGLADGSYYLCVTAQDDQGHSRPADNDKAAFSVDRTPPRASVAAVPGELDVPAVVAVGGDDVVAFVYKAGRSEDVDCAATAGYSNELPVKAPLLLSLDGARPGDRWALCLLGLDLAGNRQSAAQATRVEWRTNGIGRRLTLDLPAVIGESALSSGKLELTGSAPEDWATVQRVSVSVRHVATSKCYDGTAFAASCPSWLPARGTSPWSMPLRAKALTEADVYEVTLQAQDAAHGILAEAGGGSFSWRFGRVEITGDGHQILTHAVRTASGATIMAIELDGAFGAGADRIPRLDPSTSDWLIVRRRGDGGDDWLRAFRGEGEDKPLAVAVAADESVFVVGTTDRQLAVGEATLGGKGNRDTLLVKLAAADGAPQWTRAVATAGRDEAGGVQADPAGNAVVYGDFCDEAVDFGDGRPVTPQGCALYVAKYDGRDGALLWVRTFDTRGRANPTSLVPYGEEGWLITGQLGGELTLGPDTLTVPEGSESIGFVARLDATGQALWGRSLLGAGRQVLAGAARAPDGGVVVAGFGASGAEDLAGRALAGAKTGRNLVVGKLDPSGQALWASDATLDGDRADVFDVACDAGGDVYLLGRSQGNTSFAELADELPTAGGAATLFARFAGDDGKLVAARFFGSDADEILTRPRLSRTSANHLLLPVPLWGPMRFGSAEVSDESDAGSLLVEFAP